MTIQTEQNDLRQLNAIQTSVFVAGSLLMVAGMGCYVFMFHRVLAAVVFLVGATLFAIMQCMQTYQGDNFTIRRLKNIMNLANILFVVAGLLMIDTSTQFLRPMFRNMTIYFNYIYNKWLLVLLVAVILELYSVNRISYKLRKNKEKQN